MPSAGGASWPDPGDAISARLEVDAALQQLPADQRSAVVLRDLLDLDYAEIAEVLSIPIGTVRSRIARGRSAIASLLAHEHGPAGPPTREVARPPRSEKGNSAVRAGTSKGTGTMTDHLPAQTDGAENGHVDDETLSAHLDAELDVDEASTAARHLEACSACRARLGSLAHAAELVGQVVESPSPATRQRQLERALGLAPVRRLPDSPGSARRLALVRWAAALLVVAGGGAAIWRFHADVAGGSSASSASTTTQVPAAHAARRGRDAAPALAATSSPGSAVQGMHAALVVSAHAGGRGHHPVRRVRVRVVGLAELCTSRGADRLHRRRHAGTPGDELTLPVGDVDLVLARLRGRGWVSVPRARTSRGGRRTARRGDRLSVDEPRAAERDHDRPGADWDRPRAHR